MVVDVLGYDSRRYLKLFKKKKNENRKEKELKQKEKKQSQISLTMVDPDVVGYDSRR